MDALWIELTLLFVAVFSLKQAHFQNITTDLNIQLVNASNTSSLDSNQTTEIVTSKTEGLTATSINKTLDNLTTKGVTEATEATHSVFSETTEHEISNTDITNSGNVTQTENRISSTATDSIPRNSTNKGITESNKHAKNTQTNSKFHSTRSIMNNKTSSISTTSPLIDQTQSHKPKYKNTKSVSIITTKETVVDSVNITTTTLSSSTPARTTKLKNLTQYSLLISTLKPEIQQNQTRVSETEVTTPKPKKTTPKEKLSIKLTTATRRLITDSKNGATSSFQRVTSATVSKKVTLPVENNTSSSTNSHVAKPKTTSYTTQKVDENSVFRFPDFYSNKSLEMRIHKLGDKDDDTYWPVAVSLIIGIPAIIVIAVTITVMHKKRLGRLPARRKSPAYA